MKNRTAWEDPEAKLYFDSHVRSANGVTNLLISHTPPKFLRIMNFLGYKSNESAGLNAINEIAFKTNSGFVSKVAQLVLIYYWVYAKPHGENIPDDLSLCKHLIDTELQLYPKVISMMILCNVLCTCQ